MDTIEIDTDVISSNANDIRILVTEMKEIFDDTFDTISDLISKQGNWQGYSAETFRASALTDKSNYIHFNQSLNEYANYLSDYASEYKETLARIKK